MQCSSSHVIPHCHVIHGCSRQEAIASVSDQMEHKLFFFLLFSFIPLQYCTALHREFCCFVSVLGRHLTMELFEHKPPQTPTSSYLTKLQINLINRNTSIWNQPVPVSVQGMEGLQPPAGPGLLPQPLLSPSPTSYKGQNFQKQTPNIHHNTWII